ncbi:MAG: hypothetical protein EPN37_04065 [Chitinophagaceae bacterium]|nr:MAG: hypothetical protein EPN37_04065 [Chitinophagaceae bacterium]
MKISQQSLFKPFRKIANMGGGQAVILLYHRVIDLKPDPQELCVSPQHFREQLLFLKENYYLISAEEFADHLKNKRRFRPKSVLITFDDGYFDNFLYALPLLEESEAQAVFYITTSKLNTDEELWWDDLERIFIDRRSKPAALTLHVDGAKRRYDVRAESVLWKLYYELQNELRFSSPDKIDNVVDQLRKWSATPQKGRPSHRMLSYEELKKMAGSSSAVIGCHTHRHPALGMLPAGQQHQEIQQSKEILEDLLGKTISHFSYPFGARKFLGDKRYYNHDTIRIARELNFDMVCANYFGQVHRRSNRYVLPRMPVRDWGVDVFKEKMKEFFKG